MEKIKKIIEKLYQEMQLIANAMLNKRGVKVKVHPSKKGSYTYMENASHGSIYVNAYMLWDESLAQETNKLRAMGILYHEIGHLLYTQFEPMGRVRKIESGLQQQINLYLADHKEDIKKSDGPCMYALQKLLFNHIYYHNLSKVLNMIEDAAVECLVPGEDVCDKKQNRIFASIAAARNATFQLEREQLQEADDRASALFWDPELEQKKLDICLAEFHQLGVIGYRTQTPTGFLEGCLGQDGLERMRNYAFYGKFMTKSTEERLKVGRAVLDELSDIIQEKADTFAENMQKALLISDDPDVAMDGLSGEAPEMSISMPNMTSSGSSQKESEYQYDIPDDQKKAIENQPTGHESDKGSSKDPSGSGDDSSQADQQGASSQNAGGADEQGSDPNGSEGGDSLNPQFAEDADDAATDTGSDQPSGCAGSPGDDEDPSADSADPQTGEAAKDADASQEPGSSKEETGSEDSVGEDQTDAGESAEKAAEPAEPQKLDLPSFRALEKEADNAIRSILENDRKKAATRREQDLKKTVAERSHSREDGPAECDRDFHRGVPVDMIIHKKSNPSDEGVRVFRQAACGEFKEVIAETSREINTVKMYSAKASRRSGLRKGRLNTRSLYRSQSDGKCFKKSTPGKKKNLRIAMLLDMSGSMRGTKMVEAMKTSYILASSCQRIGVPVSVWGHHTGNGGVILHRFLDYQEKGEQNLGKVFNACSYGSNHDGLAIYQVAHDLAASRKQDEQLFLIVLSDGQPNGLGGYFGSPAEADIREIIAGFQKLYRITTIGISVETDAWETEANRRIYGENTIAVPDARDLPVETVKLLKKISE